MNKYKNISKLKVAPHLRRFSTIHLFDVVGLHEYAVKFFNINIIIGETTGQARQAMAWPNTD